MYFSERGYKTLYVFSLPEGASLEAVSERFIIPSEILYGVVVPIVLFSLFGHCLRKSFNKYNEENKPY